MNVTSTNNIYSFLIHIAPYIIALCGVLISLYSLINQRKITQQQINAETKRKFIVDLIDQCKLISKSVWTLFEISSDFSLSKKKYTDLSEMIEKFEYQDNPETKNKLKSLLEFHNHNAENFFGQIFKISKEFYYNVSSIFLYLPRNHKEIKSLRTIATDLELSFQKYP